MITLARNWDSLCLYGWKPHMFNPQLAWWLRRIAVPTLVLWGASDRIVTPEYGQSYAQRIPGAEFRIIEAAGAPPGARATAGICRSCRRIPRSVSLGQS